LFHLAPNMAILSSVWKNVQRNEEEYQYVRWCLLYHTFPS